MSDTDDYIPIVTQEESKELFECEQTISRGLKTFYEVGEALLRIRDKRLYRAEYKTFEDYCRERWGWGRNYANKQIAAAETVKNLVPMGTNQEEDSKGEMGTIVPKLPTTEGQTRPLSPLPPEEQREVWGEVLKKSEEEGKPITARDVQEAVDQKKETHNHRAQGTGENEWYTPQHYVESARSVLGVIELDPASSITAQEKINAREFFTVDQDGLAHEWNGKVWMNPPYAQPYIRQFIEKLVSEYQAGRVSEAIALTHNYTDTAWFHCAAQACTAICFTRGRIGFLDPEGNKAAPTQGQAFFYFGDRIAEFTEEFSQYGFVVVRHG